MLRLFKRERHDPEAIARVVITVTGDRGVIIALLKAFSSSEEQFQRVILGAAVYAYCWMKLWIVKQNDSRVADAYMRADAIIASHFENAIQPVPVSDYVVSELELTTFSLEFCDYFRERVPLKPDRHSNVMAEMEAHERAIRAHQICFETLIKMIMVIRTKRMTEEISRCITSKMDEQSTIMMLADTLHEQITGITPLDLGRDFALWQEWDRSRPRRTEAIVLLMSRLEMELEAL